MAWKLHKIFMAPESALHRLLLSYKKSNHAHEIGTGAWLEKEDEVFSLEFSHLRQRLESVIQSRTGGRVKHLAVQLSAEEVVLQGHANTYYVKQLAQQGVREMLPEIRLQNAIVVV